MRLCVIAVFAFIFSGHVKAIDMFGAVEFTDLSPNVSEKVWEREKQVMPRYPKALVMDGVRGCSVFDFDVTEDGKATNVEIVSSLPKDANFRPVKKQILRWDWKLVEGKAATKESKRVRLDFCMNRESRESVEAQCKAQAQMACE